MKIGHLSIAYDDKSQSSYWGVEVDISGAKKKLFFSGSFPQDWTDAVVYLDKQGAETAMCSSSVDHFIMDGNGFRGFKNDAMGGEFFCCAKDKDKAWHEFKITGCKASRMWLQTNGMFMVLEKGGKYKIVSPDGELDGEFSSPEEAKEKASNLKKKTVYC